MWLSLDYNANISKCDFELTDPSSAVVRVVINET